VRDGVTDAVWEALKESDNVCVCDNEVEAELDVEKLSLCSV